MSRMLPRHVLPMLLLVAACQTRRVVPLTTNSAGELPRRSVLVKKGGERVRVEEARLTSDSIIGLRRDGERFAVHRDSVASMELYHVNAAPVIAITIVALAAVFALWVSAYNHDANR